MIVVPGQGGRTGGAARPAEHFLGEVWLEAVLEADGVRMSQVSFAPGGRTHWHRHEGGQVLYVTSGAGWVARRGEDPVPIRAGDVIWTSPGEEHWHGATDENVMTHLPISVGPTEWLESTSSVSVSTGATSAT
jgi:quercetin dioxygenase-like cupin family protein